MPKRNTPADFWAKVDMSRVTARGMDNPCWLWINELEAALRTCDVGIFISLAGSDNDAPRDTHRVGWKRGVVMPQSERPYKLCR